MCYGGKAEGRGMGDGVVVLYKGLRQVRPPWKLFRGDVK